MKISKFIFISINTFSDRDYERYGIETLKKNGFQVQILDISYVLLKKKPLLTSFGNVLVITSYKDLEKNIINNVNDSIFIPLFGESSKLLSVNMILSKFDAKLLSLNTNILPVSIQQQSVFNKILFFLSTFSFKSIYQKTKYLYLRLNIKKFDYMLVGGIKSQIHPRVDEHTKLIYGHSFDYDIFLNPKNPSAQINYKYAVFLDEYLPYHPDGNILNREKHLQSIDKIYYAKLNNFFSYLENNYDLRIIIAAHPRANYVQKNNPFDGRVCISGDTNNLVKNAEFCIGHFSTSINFAVIYNKPIIFITMNEINHLFYDFVSTFAQKLGSIPINIDELHQIKRIDLNINNNLYKTYFENYIKSSQITLATTNWEIITQYFKPDNVKIFL